MKRSDTSRPPFADPILPSKRSETLRERARRIVPDGCRRLAKGDDRYPAGAPARLARGDPRARPSHARLPEDGTDAWPVEPPSALAVRRRN